MRLNSLAFRLVAGAAVWSVATLVAGGLVLSSLFRDSVEQGFDSRLEFLLDSLIAGTEIAADGAPQIANAPAETRFETPFSGWYWQVSSDAAPVLRSRSLWDQALPPDPESDAAPGLSYRSEEGPDSQRLRVAKRVVRLPGSDARFTIEVAGDLSEIRAEVDRFNRWLGWSLGVMVVGLIAATLIQVHYGLAPLRQLRANLAAIRHGGASRLDEALPAEIAPLAAEINTLLAHIGQVVERARTQVGNLAHALKTPLSVLTNEAGAAEAPLNRQVRKQAALMRRQVDHHLSRARAAAMVGVLGVRTEVAPVARDIARTLERIHAEREIGVEVACADGLAFGGESQDLEELIGNLLDNGVKWAHRRVRFDAEAVGGRLRIAVDDDGPGLDEAEREAVLKRGTRLDESVAGYGLGLGIVGDLVELYSGRMALARSPMGGLRVSLELPLAP